MSEANAEQTCAEPDFVSAPVADLSDPHTKPVADFAEASVADSDPANPSEREVTATAASAKAEADPPGAEAPETDAPAVPGNVILISTRDEEANSGAAEPKAEPALEQGPLGKRPLARLAAVVALAMATGALGGALATAGLSRLSAVDVERNDKRAQQTGSGHVSLLPPTSEEPPKRTSDTNLKRSNGSRERHPTATPYLRTASAVDFRSPRGELGVGRPAGRQFKRSPKRKRPVGSGSNSGACSVRPSSRGARSRRQCLGLMAARHARRDRAARS